MYKTLFFSISILFFLSANAQINQYNLREKIKEYNEIPREVAYLHLNKSTYLKGEQIAFTAYVLNKQNLEASTATNLYVLIKDDQNKVIKEKLVFVEDGTSSNTIRVDSLFTKGNYTISAFTNWMRNFEEQNYFVENIKIIEAENSDVNYSSKNIENIDVQFLPESGHLLNGVINTVGVIAKKENGNGIANAHIRILGDENQELAQCELNQFGIGKFAFIPETGTSYKAEISYPGIESKPVKINVPVKRNGIILSAVVTKEELRLLVKTNRSDFETYSNKTYFLMLHNSKETRSYDLNFGTNSSVPFLFNLKNLTPGVNTLSIVDSDNKVVAERIFFNYNDLPKTTFDTPNIKTTLDSLEIQLKTKKALDSIKVSVSVLPKKSLANQNNHSITSYLLLQPYIKGVVQQADWYFNKIDKHKVRELDKLLITQGWSAYDWDFIFNNDLKITYQSEDLLQIEGILNKPDKKNQEFLIHASSTRAPQRISLPGNTKSFIVDDFFHTTESELEISRVDGNRLLPANLFVRFSPNAFPDLYTNPPYVHLDLKKNAPNIKLEQPVIFFDEDRETLDEVVIEKRIDKVKQRERKLNNKEIYGNVKVVDLDDIMLYRTLSTYLSTQPGLNVNEPPGSLIVTAGPGNSFGTPRGLEGRSEGGSRTDSSMRFYLDDVPMENEFFYQYPLELVDYVKINRRGLGGGFMEANGSIRVYSRPGSIYEDSRTIKPQKFQLPVAFSQQKKYYIPKFSNNYSDFFQNYGVIDWKPLLKSDANGNISFKIKKPKVDYQLIIQGVSSEGVLIQDVQHIKLDDADLN
ncbi:MAG: hypothetical protein R6V36_00365 [Psychroflexus sp.]